MDTMMVSGLRWVLDTISQAALAEFKDDTPLREALLDAGVRVELGEITQEDYTLLEDQLLARINAIRDLQEADTTGPISFPGTSPQGGGEALAVEADVVGDFHQPSRRKRRSGAPAA
jgi:hypothetical protein